MTNMLDRDFPGKVVIRSDGTAAGTRVSVIGEGGKEHDVGVTEISFKMSAEDEGGICFALFKVPAPKLEMVGTMVTVAEAAPEAES